MQDTVKTKKAGFKNRIFSKIPAPLKPYARLAYFASTAPFGGQKQSNSFKYHLAVGRSEKINYVPPIFTVTINSTCNLRCPNCFYVLADGENAFKNGAMIKVDDFKSVIDKYADRIQMVWLSGGEPLAHPQFEQLVDIVKSKGLDLKTSTNGVFIERKIDILKEFDFVNVSMDGFDHESFGKYRAGTPAEFDKIVHGLSLLKENNIPFSNSFILSMENLHEANLMLEFATTTKPNLVVFHNMNPHGSEDFTSLLGGNEEVQQMLRNITSRTDYPFDLELPVLFDTTSKNFVEQKCIQQWFYASFNDKGHVSYCCHMNHDESIGNIFKGYEFNSEKMQEFRRNMINHEYPKDDCLFCQRRFMGKEYGRYFVSEGKWFLHGLTGSEAKIMDPAPSGF